MKHLRMICAIALSGLLLAGCASVAHVEKDKTVNFSRYHTYAWVDTKDSADSHKHVSDLTERNIRTAVNSELQKAGWREVKKNPDVLVSYDILIERAMKEDRNAVYSQPYSRLFFNPYLRRWGTLYYPSQFMGYDNNRRQVREGTITISMIDAATEKTIWQGWTTDEVNSRNLTNREIEAGVRSIFRKFDIAKK